MVEVIILTSCIAIILVFTPYLFWLQFRNNKVCDYRISVLRRYGCDVYGQMNKKYSYNRMLFSFRALTDNNWIVN